MRYNVKCECSRPIAFAYLTFMYFMPVVVAVSVFVKNAWTPWKAVSFINRVTKVNQYAFFVAENTIRVKHFPSSVGDWLTYLIASIVQMRCLSVSLLRWWSRRGFNGWNSHALLRHWISNLFRLADIELFFSIYQRKFGCCSIRTNLHRGSKLSWSYT